MSSSSSNQTPTATDFNNPSLEEERSSFLYCALSSLLPAHNPSDNPTLDLLLRDLAQGAKWELAGEGGLSAANLFSVHLLVSSSSFPPLPSEFNNFKHSTNNQQIDLMVKESPLFFNFPPMCADLWREPAFYLEMRHQVLPHLLIPDVLHVQLPNFNPDSPPSPASSPPYVSRICMANALKKGSRWKVPGILGEQEARVCVESLAKFHARFAHGGPSNLPPDPTLTRARLPFVSHHFAQIFPILENAEVTAEKIRKFAPLLVGEDEGRGASELIEKVKGGDLFVMLGERLGKARGGTLSVLHLDVRSGNLFVREKEEKIGQDEEGGAGSNLEIMFYDWQGVCRGPTMFDLAYLASSLDIKTRRTSLPSLLSLYHTTFTKTTEALQKDNHTLPPIPSLVDLTLQFRASLLWPVLWAACSLQGPEELVEKLLRDRPLSKEKALEFMVGAAQRQMLCAMEMDPLGAMKELGVL